MSYLCTYSSVLTEHTFTVALPVLRTLDTPCYSKDIEDMSSVPGVCTGVLVVRDLH